MVGLVHIVNACLIALYFWWYDMISQVYNVVFAVMFVYVLKERYELWIPFEIREALPNPPQVKCPSLYPIKPYFIHVRDTEDQP